MCHIVNVLDTEQQSRDSGKNGPCRTVVWNSVADHGSAEPFRNNSTAAAAKSFSTLWTVDDTFGDFDNKDRSGGCPADFRPVYFIVNHHTASTGTETFASASVRTGAVKS